MGWRREVECEVARKKSVSIQKYRKFLQRPSTSRPYFISATSDAAQLWEMSVEGPKVHVE